MSPKADFEADAMPRFLVYLIYNSLLPGFLLLGLPAFIVKGVKRGGLTRNFRQRLGWFHEQTLHRFESGHPLWIHAVSVGEVLLALKIIKTLHETEPRIKILLSTTTTTAFDVADEHTHEFLTVIHNPVDIPFVNSRVIKLIKPEQLILIEAEIWPNLVRQLNNRGIPIKLVNARLSPRSQRRYQKALHFIRPVFSQIDQVTVPFEADVARWVSVGIDRDRIRVLGSVKFDNALAVSDNDKINELKEWLIQHGLPRNSRIMLGGSTHDGEELLLAETAQKLKADHPDLELVIIPRHAERGREIAKQLETAGFLPILRKTDETKVDSSSSKKKIWIANTTGELRSWYFLAEIVVVGKSFCGRGGQNPVEPILTGKPTIVGPNMENFVDIISNLVKDDAIVQIAGHESLFPTVNQLLSDPTRCEALIRNGATALERHQGATKRTVEMILEGLRSH